MPCQQYVICPPDKLIMDVVILLYHIPGNSLFRPLAKSEYPSTPKSVLSSIAIRQCLTKAKTTIPSRSRTDMIAGVRSLPFMTIIP